MKTCYSPNPELFKHNKKRNIGLLSEFFSRYIAAAIIEKRYSDIDKAKRIWDKYFDPSSSQKSSSRLYSELKLFNMMYSASFKNKEIVLSLMEKIKSECQTQKQEQLDKEKLALINEINNVLKDPEFFEREVPDYKSYASVQLLMNAWRGTGFKGNLEELARLEENVLERMLLEKEKPLGDSMLKMTEPEVDGLVLKLMHEKLNEKYSKIFNTQQKEIVDLYIFSAKENKDLNFRKLGAIFENLKVDTLGLIKEENGKFDANLRTKLSDIKTMLVSEKYNITVDDESVGFYLGVAKLKEELESKEDRP